MSTRLWVGGLEAGIAERDLEDEFSKFGRLRSVWVARKPPGFAFVEFEDTRDADDAVRKLDGYQPPSAMNPWRVEVSRKGEPRRGGPPGGGGYSDRGPPPARGEAKCYSCGEFGHFARECRNGGGGGGGGGGMRGGGGGRGGDRYDSRGGGGYDRDGGRDRYAPDNRRRSPEYEGRGRRRSPSYDRARSPSR